MVKTAFLEDVLAPSCKIEMCPNKAETRPLWLSLPRRGPSRRKPQKKGREPILPENDSKPFRMISLRKISQQLTWIDILTKNTGGGGIYHFLTPQLLQPPSADLAKEPKVDRSRFRVSALWRVSSFCVSAMGKPQLDKEGKAHTKRAQP
jgi:hypothetical protein